MAGNSKNSRDVLFKLNQLLVEDLINTPEDELLKEISENPSLKQRGINAKEVYKMALQQSGKRRLANARQQMSLNVDISTMVIDPVTAHKTLATLVAANDPQVTIAARNLESISDSEAVELVKELIALGAISKDLLS